MIRLLFLLLAAGCEHPASTDTPTTIPSADDCGTGDWGDIPVDDDTVFVDGQAGDGGTGTAEAPFQNVQEAADEAGSRGGGLVAIAAGWYVENLAFDGDHDNVVLAGRCPELVTLDGSNEDGEPTLALVGTQRGLPELGVDGLTVTGGEVGLWIESGVATISHTVVEENRVDGLLALSATVDLLDVSILGTTRSGRGPSYGIEVAGSEVHGQGVTLGGNALVGIGVYPSGASLTLVDSFVEETSADGSDGGYGIVVESGAYAEVSGTVIRGNTGAGVYVEDNEADADNDGNGTEVVLLNTLVAGTLPWENGTGGVGIVVVGGKLTGEGLRVEGNSESGVEALGPRANVTLVGSEVSGNIPGPQGNYGYGIGVQDGAQLTASDVSLKGNTTASLFAGGYDTRVFLNDVEIKDTRPVDATSEAIGLNVYAGAEVVVDGLFITGTMGTGIQLVGDTVVLGTNVLVEGGQGIGVLAGTWGEEGVAVVALENSLIENLDPFDDGTLGYGLHATSGGHILAADLTLDGNTGCAVLAAGHDASVVLTRAEITATRKDRQSAVAFGVAAQEEGSVLVTESLISGTEGPGVYVTADGAVTLTNTDVDFNAFAGAAANGGVLTLDGVSISNTQVDTELGGGIGVYVLNEDTPPQVSIRDSTIGPHRYAAVWLDGPGSYDIESTSFEAGDGLDLNDWPLHGNAIFAENGVERWDGTTGLRLSGNTFSGANAFDTQVAVLLDDASALFEGNTWDDNVYDVWQQSCGTATLIPAAELQTVPQARPCPGSADLLVDANLHFASIRVPDATIEE